MNTITIESSQIISDPDDLEACDFIELEILGCKRYYPKNEFNRPSYNRNTTTCIATHYINDPNVISIPDKIKLKQ